jgi:hypothetical protein
MSEAKIKGLDTNAKATKEDINRLKLVVNENCFALNFDIVNRP